MSSTPPPSLQVVLREHRLAAGLTLEALAERAGVSMRAIQNLERGANRPLKDTVRRLVAALDLPAAEQAALLAAATPAPRRRPLGGGGADAGRTVGATLPPPSAGHNLPAAASSFIGRAHERERVTTLLRDARLVTLTGPGGVGKTRLALAVAEGRIGGHPDGVWLVELAPLADRAAVPGAVATVLGLREEPGRPLPATIAASLAHKDLLLLLDNCEHLLAACADLAALLLRACPSVRLMATSREGLGVAGERRYRVPPLSVPDPQHLPPPELAASYEAVRLFVERARERRDDFALTGGNARAVAEVCARLDGIPLAIELAAARVGGLSPEAIAARLDERFRLLGGGRRDLPTRQRTLRATLDWSWGLLEDRERTLLGRLSVFQTGWALGAAEAVCAGEDLERWDVLDGLDALVNRSLVQVDEDGEEEARYRLLETVREYAAERLAERGGAAAVRDRHLAWALALAEEAAPALRGPAQGTWATRLAREHDNLLAALRWSGEAPGRLGAGLQIACALLPFWLLRGHTGEGRRWLEQHLADGDAVDETLRARALAAAGDLAWTQADSTAARARYRQCLGLYRALGDTRGVMATLVGLGDVTDEIEEQRRIFTESLALARALGQVRGIAVARHNLGKLAYFQGEYVQAQAAFAEALPLLRQLGDQSLAANTLLALGEVAAAQGDFQRAVAHYEQNLALQRELGNAGRVGRALGRLGLVACARGDLAGALALLEEALALGREADNKPTIGTALTGLGAVAYLQGEYERATAYLEEGLAAWRGLQHLDYAQALQLLASVEHRAGHSGRAGALHREALVLGRQEGLQGVLAEGLERLCWLLAAQGQARAAARLGGAAEALRAVLEVPLPLDTPGTQERALGTLRSVLGEGGLAAAWAAGRALTVEAAIAEAL